MEDLKLQVSAFQKELGQVVKELAAKHGVTLSKNNLRYDQYQWNVSLKFNVVGKQQELKALEASLYKSQEDPNVGSIVNYRGVDYKVVTYNRAGNMIAERRNDGRSFKFRRNKVTFKFDYFTNVVTA
jgi:hypothetical protein